MYTCTNAFRIYLRFYNDQVNNNVFFSIFQSAGTSIRTNKKAQGCAIPLARETLLIDMVIGALRTMRLCSFCLSLFCDNLGHGTDGTGVDLFKLLQVGSHLVVGNLLRTGALRRRRKFVVAARERVLIVRSVVGHLRCVLGGDRKHTVVLAADGSQFGEGSRTGRAVLLRVHVFGVLFLVFTIRSSVFLLLNGNGEAVVLFLLGETRIIEAGRGYTAAWYNRSGSHHDIIAIRKFAFFAHDCKALFLSSGDSEKEKVRMQCREESQFGAMEDQKAQH